MCEKKKRRMRKMQQSGCVKPPRTASKRIQPVLKAASRGVTPAPALREGPGAHGSAHGTGTRTRAEPASCPTSGSECGKEERAHGGSPGNVEKWSEKQGGLLRTRVGRSGICPPSPAELPQEQARHQWHSQGHRATGTPCTTGHLHCSPASPRGCCAEPDTAAQQEGHFPPLEF